MIRQRIDDLTLLRDQLEVYVMRCFCNEAHA